MHVMDTGVDAARDVKLDNDDDGFTTDSSSAPALSADFGTPTTEPTSLGSGISNQSLSTVKETPPPSTKWPYVPSSALDDIPPLAFALDLFLKSQMVESEEYCHSSDPKKERLYFATGYGLIQCVKALMSYEDEDLLAAINHTKHGNTIASQHRKRSASLPWRLAGYVTGSSGVGWIRGMTPVERHAELVYAESLFEKALLGIVYSGDWLAFIKEALNMRTTIQIYRQLGKFLDTVDAEADARGEGPEDRSIDAHFRTGVYLGVGMSNIILSLMPAKLLTIVELFGYKGDRQLGLALLQKAGGWSSESALPSVSRGEEGVRRSICDMALLIFHLVLSSFTYAGVDVLMAQKILDWNLERYPNGVFFLFGQGRLSLCRSQPRRAIACYQHALRAQDQYRNLHHVSFWEMAVANLALWELDASLACWRSLQKESTWSKACYTYGTAALLLQLGGEENRKEAVKLMAEVPALRQRIAGKSIPLEKFVARKARKCQSQDGRLALPALELAYLFLGIAHAPRAVILQRMLPLIDAQLARGVAPSAQGYWDDWCLARFLEGVCMRYVAYPDPDALLDPDEEVGVSQADASARAFGAFEAVFANGPKIELDHQVVYYAHFEYGRLLACTGDRETSTFPTLNEDGGPSSSISLSPVMTSVAGRKKSIISSAAVSIDIPVANNTLLNKAASQSTSLYQQCSSLRTTLLRIYGFSDFFALSAPPDSSRQSTDPVTQLWDCFALGTPLCYLYNLLPPPATPIAVNTDPATVDIHNERTKKRAIALFAMQIKQLSQAEQFTVTDLWDRNSTDGLVKVITTVTHLVDRLPPDVFLEEESQPSPSIAPNHDSVDSLAPASAVPAVAANAKEGARNNIVRELVETERKYVQDLEVMQKYSNSLSQSNTIDQDTIHLLFPNLNKLLNFQRKFLIRLEGTAEMPWIDQRWGILFTDNEEEFAVYEPYCANYTNASDLMLMEEQNLMKFSHLINAKSELPAFLIKPVQRICKYPLLLDSLLKASSPADYPHYEELKAGSAAAKRITDKINEAQRRAENVQTVQNLATRVDDWKGHHVSQFGELLLDDIFTVTKSEVDREYHVFLFERIILCCKEDLGPVNGKKVNKSNSILKKPQTPTASTTPSPAGPSKKKSTPLLLKGRIYLNNVTDAKAHIQSGVYSLNVWWKGDDDLEFFTLRCRNEEQVKQWETSIKRLIEKVAARRASDRSTSRLAQHMNSTSPALPNRAPPSAYQHERNYSTSQSNGVPAMPTHPYGGGHPYSTGGRSYRHASPYGSDEHVPTANGAGSFSNGPHGYPPHDGFDEADDEFEDYPPSAMQTSGRGTPADLRRGTMTPSLEREFTPAYERAPRAQTEDVNGTVMSSWRNNNQAMMPPPLPVSGLPNGPSPRPSISRLTSTQSTMSRDSDSSFGSRPPPSMRPGLPRQVSSSRLRSTYENSEPRSGASSPQILSVPPPPLRSRSASQPNAYIPKSAVPPLPVAPWDRSKSSTETKRSSGSSHSTNENSEDSPNSSSPITPFGSSDSSIGAIGGHPYANGRSMVKVKVHFGNDIFVIQVPRTMDYDDLVEKVGKKIRLCGPRRDDGPLRVRYEDEEGDLVSMRSDEDVDMAFGGKNQVTLHVE